MASIPPSSPPASVPARYPRVILGTCVVPWRPDGTWDEPLFRRTVRHAVETLGPHQYIFGTAGEGYAVTDRQFAEIGRAFVEEMRAAGGEPMIGVISLSLGTVQERIALALEWDVREFQLSLPAWGVLEDAEVDRFFAATCGQFPAARFLHYNLARAKRVLGGADYTRLAGRHPNLVAIKMGGENVPALRDVATAADAAGVRCFFTEFGYHALADTSGCGLLCSFGGCEPALARRWFSASTLERVALEPAFRAIHAAAKSALAGAAYMDGAYDKLYIKRHFPAFPLDLLPPYRGATEAQFARFRAACDAALAAVPAQPVSAS
jgi:dihydrodipicolinate synthase/N-acetylneuraminate lyase